MAVRAVHKGIAPPPGPAAQIVREYVQRQRLAKMGFTSPLDTIDADKAELLLFVSNTFDEMREEDLKKRKGARRG